MAEQNARLGAMLMVAATLVFSAQDVLSRHLAESHSVMMVVMIRFWAFAAFVTLLAARSPGGLRAAVRTDFPAIQVLRGLLLVAEVCVMIVAFVRLGLIETHAVFICYPLLVAALSGPVLGEKVGWRRWTAIGIGFVGVLIILQPGFAVFSPWALLPLSAAFMFALYGLLTRYVARSDAASVSFFWTGVVGALAMTPLGLMNWTPMDGPQAATMALLCVTAMLGHWLLIKAYDVAEASAVQPFAYLQLVWSAALAMWIFDEKLRNNVAIGAGLVAAAGLFTLWRQRQKAREAR